MQAVKTNIEGTDNVLLAAIDPGVERVVCFSTDKGPIQELKIGVDESLKFIVDVEHIQAVHMLPDYIQNIIN